jgi:hypothetical protein
MIVVSAVRAVRWASVTAPETWELVSLVSGFVGICIELLGVLTVMAADYRGLRGPVTSVVRPGLQRVLDRLFTTGSERAVDRLDGYLTEQRVKLSAASGTPTFEPVVTDTASRRFRLLQWILQPELGAVAANATEFGFVVTPGGTERFAIQADRPTPVQVTDTQYERLFDRARARAYYRTGAVIIVIGVCLLVISQGASVLAVVLRP